MTRIATTALAVAVTASAVTVSDAVYGSVTGRNTFWDGATGQQWVVTAVTAMICVLYGSLTAMLVQRAEAIDGGSGVIRWIRRLLLTDLGVLAAIFVAGTALGEFPAPVEVVASVAFVLMFILGLALGIGLVRRPALRTPAALMIAPLVLMPAVIALDAIVPGWGHPGYAEAALYIGLALLGRAPTAVAVRPEPSMQRAAG